jgi:hypothetical protein
VDLTPNKLAGNIFVDGPAFTTTTAVVFTRNDQPASGDSMVPPVGAWFPFTIFYGSGVGSTFIIVYFSVQEPWSGTIYFDDLRIQ